MMEIPRLRLGYRLQHGLLVIAVYFVVFPGDLSVLLAPFSRLLAITQSVALGVYLFLAVMLICWTAWLIWVKPRGHYPPPVPVVKEPVA